MGILYQSIKYKGYYVPNAMSENTDADARTGYTATCEYEAEKSTTGDNDYNQTCDDCGKAFHAYEVPGRTVYKCNDCKV